MAASTSHAGPEIGVASTKAFTSQVTVLALLALVLGRLRGLSRDYGIEIARELALLPDKIQKALEGREVVRQIADRYTKHENLHLPRARVPFPGRTRGRPQAEGDLVHPRRGLSRRPR
jgi:glucosamine--fructose-6-phosphate aminotransferase (isomerizing)